MSSPYADDCFTRAMNALQAAELLSDSFPDDAASRAYYAAFHAVSAAFACAGRTFRKHSAVRAAVHRDLVASGDWDAARGEAYDFLWSLRDTGDYGGGLHVTSEEAGKAVEAAREIIEAVKSLRPELSRDSA